MKQQQIILIVFLVLTVLSFSKCKKKDNIPVQEEVPVQKEDGIILWKGPIDSDGCDWLIDIDRELFHADNLPDDFKIDSLQVNIKYSILPKENNFICSWTSFRRIYIQSIYKK